MCRPTVLLGFAYALQRPLLLYGELDEFLEALVRNHLSGLIATHIHQKRKLKLAELQSPRRTSQGPNRSIMMFLIAPNSTLTPAANP